MANNNNTSGLNTPTILLIGGSILFFWDKIFGKSEADKKAEAEEEKLTNVEPSKNPLTESFKPVSKIPPGNIILRTTKTNPAVPAGYFSKAVIDIKNAIGTFTDDESKILSSIKKAATKYEINLMSRLYTQLYKRDLLFDLKDNLNAKEITPILTHINKLPLYIKGTKK
ncbi:MAG: hypothetical protein H7836_14030 [Magnetococcus sp. YQC-3]